MFSLCEASGGLSTYRMGRGRLHYWRHLLDSIHPTRQAQGNIWWQCWGTASRSSQRLGSEGTLLSDPGDSLNFPTKPVLKESVVAKLFSDRDFQRGWKHECMWDCLCSSGRERALWYLPVQCIKGFFTALNITLKRFLLGVDTNVDFEAVGGQESLSTAFLVTHKGVFPSVRLLVGAQVACGAVGTRTALKCALVAFHLSGKTKTAKSNLPTAGILIDLDKLLSVNPSYLPRWTRQGMFLPVQKITTCLMWRFLFIRLHIQASH